MTIGSESELVALRRAGRAVADALAAMKAAVAPGITTAALDDIGKAALAPYDAISAPQRDYGFPGFNCISVNDAIVHGVPGPRAIEPGDLVKLDVTVVVDGFVADAAITVAVPPIEPARAALVICAQHALARALEVVRPGVKVREIGRAVQTEVQRHGFHVLRELAGHGVGRKIHEPPQVPNFPDPLQRDVLHEGLVFALEPLVAERRSRVLEDADGWTLRTDSGAWAAHAEHTVLVTADGYELITG
ncbi:MAG: type I methionyl aminopeptidase [Planctomycetota bacterium]